MPRIFNSFRLAVTSSSLLAALLGGCGPAKTVSLTSMPDGAHLTFFRVAPGGDETKITPDNLDITTPTSQGLDFNNNVHYRVEAHRVLCMPAPDTEINFDAQTAYNITLTQFKTYIAAIDNRPDKQGDIWQIKPTPVQTVASLDPAEPASLYIDQPQPVTKNKSADIDFPAFDTSSTSPLMVYEQVQPDSSSKTGYASRLYKLPLAAGESPTLLTLNRRQQRGPTFDFSGDNIVFNSNDDSRTDSPFEFKTADNESSVSHLAHDADALEFGLTVGKDAMVYASYAANATDPRIEAASPDGSGATPRATGLCPQLSPDGNLIVYMHRPETGGKWRICTVNTRGPIMEHEVVQNDDVDFLQPHWSPDGQLIVFCSPSRGKDQPEDWKKEPNPKYHDADSEHSFLWIASADGKHMFRLTKNESFDSNPVFDRNGRTIYFRSNRGGAWNIWKLNLTDAAYAELKVNPPAQ
jgi:Tol biopolymer transport system component